MKVTSLTENIFANGAKVDRDAGVIRGVRILGRESKNGRTYTDQALAEAAKLYAGSGVNLNHPGKTEVNAARAFEAGIGWLESITVKPDGVYGDLHYFREHPYAPVLAESAERNPRRFGLSHNAEGDGTRKGGQLIVESIKAVRSVDLVQGPATNRGLFESANQSVREVLEQHAPKLLAALTEQSALLPPESMDASVPPVEGEDSAAAVKAALVQMLTAVVEMPGDIKTICTQLIDVAQKIMAGQPDETAESPGGDELDAETDDEKPPADDSAGAGNVAGADDDPLKKKKEQPMPEGTTPKTIEQRLSLLEAENKELREQQEHRELKDKCEQLLRSRRRDVTNARLTALANMPDEASRMELIEEWEPIPEVAPTPRQKPNFSAPLRESKDHSYPSDIKSFVEACR